MPGISVKLSNAAFLTASNVLNRLARSLAVLLPTFGIPSAKINASSLQSLLFSIAERIFPIRFSPKPGRPEKLAGVSS